MIIETHSVKVSITEHEDLEALNYKDLKVKDDVVTGNRYNDFQKILDNSDLLE